VYGSGNENRRGTRGIGTVGIGSSYPNIDIRRRFFFDSIPSMY
jgi:hypothetical protein